MSKQKRKKRKTIKNVLVTILTILLILAIAVYIAVKVFVVEQVEVEGNELYDSAVIEKTILNDEYSWNTLYVYFKYRLFDTGEIPFIDTMEVSITNPTTLHVVVYEKIMLGCLYIPEQSQYAYIDTDGFVVELSERIIPGVPILEGIECKEVALYEKLPIDKDDLWNMLTLSQTLKRDELVPDRIVYGEKGAPILQYGDIAVYLGSQESLTQKVERIKKILLFNKGKKGILHLENWTGTNSNIIFEEY